MKQVSIRKRLTILGLALMLSVMAQDIKVPDGIPAPYPPGPSIIAI